MDVSVRFQVTTRATEDLLASQFLVDNSVSNQRERCKLNESPQRACQASTTPQRSICAPSSISGVFRVQQQQPHGHHGTYSVPWPYNYGIVKRKKQHLTTNSHGQQRVHFLGGSDSLMAGDEDGLGDPIEDCVSITAVATLDDPRLHQNNKMLLVVGLGAPMGAVAELTHKGGFLGSLSVEATSEGFQCYKDCVQHIYSRQSFRSVLTGCILAAAKGQYGHEVVPEGLEGRVRVGEAFVWPLMAMLWAFDVNKVPKRSMLSTWIEKCATVGECYGALGAERAKLEKEGHLRDVEHLPGQ
ncbi:hypothetical protein QOT17_001977 [Balamuthia mandrillaris]